MRGVSEKPGWFWLFLLEGILTFLIGLAVRSPKMSVYEWPKITFSFFTRVISICHTQRHVLGVLFGANLGIPSGKRLL